MILQCFVLDLLFNCEINREIILGSDKVLSKNISKIAKEKNITMYRLAKESDLSMSYVWEICKGKKENPSITVISKIARVLNTTVDELIS